MELSKNPYAYALWGIVVLVGGGLLYKGVLQWPQVWPALVTLGLPSVLSLKGGAS